MADAVAQALNNSGELNLMLGDITSARENLTKATQLLANLETGGGEAGDLLKRRARVYSNLSDAYTASRMPAAAVEQAKLADSAYKQLSEVNGDSPAGRRLLAASSLTLGRKMSDAHQPGEAGIYIERAATLLRQLETEQIVNERDLAALAAVSFERGRIERALGNREEAVKAQIDAIDRYLALIEALPEISDYRFQLARAYGEAADLAALLGEPGEAKTANDEAAGLLRQLAEEDPEQPAFRFELAKRLRAAASALRDAGSGSKALAEGEKTIVLLQDLVNSNPDNPEYAYELAIVSGIQADMLAEAKQTEKALDHGEKAVNVMQTLLTEDLDPADNNGKRPKYRHALAALYGKLGHYSERSGDKDAALRCFEKSLKQYQTLANSSPGDETATKGVTWAEDRIGRLQ